MRLSVFMILPGEVGEIPTVMALAGTPAASLATGPKRTARARYARPILAIIFVPVVSGAPQSTNIAPRPRFCDRSQVELSLAPAGNSGASATPSPMRLTASEIPPVATLAIA
jgi:hypothetical protein